MNKANYITIDEFKAYNPETDFTNHTSAVLSGMIARASAFVDDFLHYSLKVEDISNEISDAIVTTDGDLRIYPEKIPLISVSKIELKLGTYNSSLSLTDSDGNNKYEIPKEKSYILYPYTQIELSGSVSLRNLWDIRQRQYYTRLSYRAGYTTIPDILKDAVNLITKDIFMRQANPMDLSSVSQGGISMSYRKQQAGKSDLVKDAIRILQPYVKIIQ